MDGEHHRAEKFEQELHHMRGERDGLLRKLEHVEAEVVRHWEAKYSRIMEHNRKLKERHAHLKVSYRKEGHHHSSSGRSSSSDHETRHGGGHGGAHVSISHGGGHGGGHGGSSHTVTKTVSYGGNDGGHGGAHGGVHSSSTVERHVTTTTGYSSSHGSDRQH